MGHISISQVETFSPERSGMRLARPEEAAAPETMSCTRTGGGRASARPYDFNRVGAIGGARVARNASHIGRHHSGRRQRLPVGLPGSLHWLALTYLPFVYTIYAVNSQTGRLSGSSAFRPAGGDIPRRTRNRLIHGSIGRFAVFAHVVLFVVQTLTT